MIVLAPHDAAWREQLQDSLALLDAEIWGLRQRNLPGDRWRVADLLVRVADRKRQLEGLGIGS